MTIRYYEVERMGRVDRYVRDSEIAMYITMVTGKASLNERIMQGLERLGCKFKLVKEKRK
jgi:hypothetical protein